MAARVSALLIMALAAGGTGCGSDAASSPPSDAGAGTAGVSGSSGSGGSGASGGSSAGSSGTGSGGVGGSAGSAAGSSGSGGTSGSDGSGGSSGSSGSGGSAGAAGMPSGCPANVDGSAPVPSGATVQPVHAGHKFLEGPVWFASRGVLLFSDMDFGAGGSENVPPSIIYQLTPPNTVTSFITQVGSNGLAVDPQQRLVAAAHDQRNISRFDLVTKQRSTIVGDYMGSKFSSPNDVIVRSDGTVYFTDPTWQLGNRTREIQFKGVFRVPPGGGAELVSDAVGSPNGIALSPDESALYVTDDSVGAVLRFTVAADGSTSGGGKIADVGGADGMAVDCAGNLYVTANEGIKVLTAAGAPVTTITLPQKPNNCTFGGADRKTLYLAGRDTLYAITLAVPGLP